MIRPMDLLHPAHPCKVDHRTDRIHYIQCILFFYCDYDVIVGAASSRIDRDNAVRMRYSPAAVFNSKPPLN